MASTKPRTSQILHHTKILEPILDGLGHPCTAFGITGVGDETDKVERWLAAGGSLFGLGVTRPITISRQVTVPAGASVSRVHFLFTGEGNNIVLMSSGSEFYGAVTGTGDASKVERAFYPATDGASDVRIFAVVDNVTIGAQAQPLADTVPEGWSGMLRFKRVVGTGASGTGYGVLLSPANNCRFEVDADDVKRHVAYLSAGASGNSLDVRFKRCGDIAVQLYSKQGQPETKDNIVNVWAGDLYHQGNQGYVSVLLGACRSNEVHIRKAVGGYGVVKVEGSQAESLIPNNNTVYLHDIEGEYKGGDVCSSIDARGTVFDVGHWFASATYSCIAFRKTSAFSYSQEWIAGEVRGCHMSARGTQNVGIYSDTGVPVKLNMMNIATNGEKVKVDEGMRIGFTRKAALVQKVNVDATTTANVEVNLPFSPKTVNTQVVNFSAANTQAVSWMDGALSAGTTKRLYVYNPASQQQDITIQITIEGD